MDELVMAGSRRWGQLASRPTVVNPLDAYAGVRRAWQRLRLKEWLAWTLMHPEISSSMVIQDAHYLASSEIYVRDAGSGLLTQHSRTARGGSPALPATLDGSAPSFRAASYAIDYSFDRPGGSHRIQVEIGPHRDQAALSFDLTLDDGRASAPLSVSSPLPGEPGAAMYTHKRVFPVSGTITVGARAYDVRPDRDLIILDEHHTFLPYRTRWLWGTFAEQQADGIVGANLCQRPVLSGTSDESCLWLPGRLEPLTQVSLAETPAPRGAPTVWRARSADGRVDVTFTPDGRKDVRHQLVLVAIDYWQLYGTWTGRVGDHVVEGVRGVMESMRARL
jgi:hypothetical protein